jgi:hypothetical protein
MADYLTDLAAGLSGAAGFLRPRQPSLFEPASGEEPIPQPSQPLEQVEETYAPPRPPELSREPPPSAVKPAMHRADTLALEQPSVEPETAAPTAKRGSRSAEKPAVEDPPSVERRPASRDAALAAGSEPSFPARDAREPPFSAQDTPLPRHSSGTRPEIKKLESAATPTPSVPIVERIRPVETRPLAPARQPTIDRPAEAADVFRPPPPPLPPPIARVRERPRQSQSRAEKQAEPTIHITIGRVEVRATSEVEPRARRKEDVSPVMTLEEYLRQRGSR